MSSTRRVNSAWPRKDAAPAARTGSRRVATTIPPSAVAAMILEPVAARARAGTSIRSRLGRMRASYVPAPTLSRRPSEAPSRDRAQKSRPSKS